jgi:hypothetical protein
MKKEHSILHKLLPILQNNDTTDNLLKLINGLVQNFLRLLSFLIGACVVLGSIYIIFKLGLIPDPLIIFITSIIVLFLGGVRIYLWRDKK